MVKFRTKKKCINNNLTGQIYDDLPQEVVGLEPVIVPHSDLQGLVFDLLVVDVLERHGLVPLGVQCPRNVLCSPLVLRAL